MRISTQKIERLPYDISCTWARDYCRVFIEAWSPDYAPKADGGMFSLGLPMDFVKFFIEFGSCDFCHAPIDMNFGRCKCRRSQNSYYLSVRYPTDLDISHFKKFFKRERSRVSSLERRKLMTDNGGIFSSKHVEGMHKAQLGVCYYCCSPIQLGNKSIHADHYLPLCAGGRNDLENMVLACAQCNMQKKTMTGSTFDGKVRKLRNPEFNKLFLEMRRSLGKYKKVASIGR